MLAAEGLESCIAFDGEDTDECSVDGEPLLGALSCVEDGRFDFGPLLVNSVAHGGNQFRTMFVWGRLILVALNAVKILCFVVRTLRESAVVDDLLASAASTFYLKRLALSYSFQACGGNCCFPLFIFLFSFLAHLAVGIN